MSRKAAVVATIVGAILVGGSAAPAFAGPLDGSDEPTTICLRLEPESGAREGVCVWLPRP